MLYYNNEAQINGMNLMSEWLLSFNVPQIDGKYRWFKLSFTFAQKQIQTPAITNRKHIWSSILPCLRCITSLTLWQLRQAPALQRPWTGWICHNKCKDGCEKVSFFKVILKECFIVIVFACSSACVPSLIFFPCLHTLNSSPRASFPFLQTCNQRNEDEEEDWHKVVDSSNFFLISKDCLKSSILVFN